MDYKTLTDEQLQTERQNIMDEIARRNDLADIPKQAEEMALRFEELGGNKSDLAQIVNDATEKIATPEPEAEMRIGKEVTNALKVYDGSTFVNA